MIGSSCDSYPRGSAKATGGEGFIEQYDQDLQNPIKADTFMSDSDFFAKYEKIKGELDEQMYEWESLQSKMEVLLKQR